MSRSTDTNQGGEFQASGRGRGVREYHEPQLPTQQVEEITRQELAEHSPDGRLPDPESRGRGRTVLWVLLLVGIPLVLATVIYIGGIPALLMGLVYVVVFAAVAFPVWYAGLMRKREEDEATQIVKHTLEEKHNKERAA